MNTPPPLPEPYYSDDLVTLYHGEALDMLGRLRGLGALITDPPYSSGGQFRGDRSAQPSTKYVDNTTIAYRPEFAGDNRDQRGFAHWAALWLNAARLACNIGAPICCFSDWRQLPTITDAIQAGGWIWRGIAPWDKGYGRPRPGGFSSACEFIIWGTNGPMPRREVYAPGIFRQSSPTGKAKKHIAQKPVPVMQWLNRIVDRSAVVCDPFAGSGSTLVACSLDGLKAIGIEGDLEHLANAAERLREAREQRTAAAAASP
jgi:site-specific DNA-methyltransferase (adenine-specific)